MPVTHFDLRNVTVQFNGHIYVSVKKVDFEFALEKKDARAGTSWVPQQVITGYGAKMSMNGIERGTELTRSFILGAALTDFLLDDEEDGSVIPPGFFTLFPIGGWVIDALKSSLTGDPSEWNIVFDNGILNPNPLAITSITP
jgi:hypothetical protein